MIAQSALTNRLLDAGEPAVRFKIRVNVLGENVTSAAVQQLQQEIKISPRVQTLLSERNEEGRIPRHPYAKWIGAHWVLADERTEELASRLVAWQWPDGGWNCDKNPQASHSSFHESLIPLRGLALHGRMTGNQQSAVRWSIGV